MSKYPSRCKAFVRIVSLHETVRWAPQEEGQNAGHDPDQVQHPLSIAVLDGCLAAAQDAPEPAQKASRKAIEKRASFYNSLEKRKRSARRRDDRALDGRAIEIDRVRLSSRLKGEASWTESPNYLAQELLFSASRRGRASRRLEIERMRRRERICKGSDDSRGFGSTVADSRSPGETESIRALGSKASTTARPRRTLFVASPPPPPSRARLGEAALST